MSPPGPLFSLIAEICQSLGIEGRKLLRGEHLVRCGDASDEIYFVLAGRFAAVADGKTIGYIDPGGVIGEFAFFTGGRRSTDVIAFRDALVVEVNGALYEEISELYPQVKDLVARELAQRVASAVPAAETAQLLSNPNAIALISGGNSKSMQDIEHRLVVALNQARPARLVHRSDGPSGESSNFESHDTLEWFSTQQRLNEVVVYGHDRHSDHWNRAIIRQSDHVLIVADQYCGAKPNPLESYALEMLGAENCSLVILHETRSRVAIGSKAVLSDRRIQMHHHVSLCDDYDVERVARFLTGRALALVCSGGGARGAAHIGVWDALRHAGIEVDAFIGTSVGSAMAGAFSLGMTGVEISDRVEDIFVTHRALKRPTLPIYALLDHTVFENKLKEHYGTVDIRDLWVPFVAVAADLTNSKTEAIKQGELWQAIRSSSAIPGILPPVITEDGRVLVDGGVIENLPFRTARLEKSGPNIMVSLEGKKWTALDSVSSLPNRLGILKNWVRSWIGYQDLSSVPRVFETLTQSMTVSQASQTLVLRDDEWLIKPLIDENIGFMDWTRHREITSQAYNFTAELLERNDNQILQTSVAVEGEIAAED